MLKKNKSAYDLFMLDIVYTRRFSKYVVDLNEYLPQSLIEKYSKGIASDISFYNGKLVGLPLYIDVSVLFSNKELLQRYNKTIPETWDELLETSTYILEKEKEKGNTDLVGYMGHFPGEEAAICSSLEFIYSYRDTVDSPIPDYLSDNAINAFKKIKELKEKLSSDDSFKCQDIAMGTFLYFGKAIFARFWKTPVDKYYYTTPLPGYKKGLSASCVGGYNIVMNNNIDIERKEAAAKVIEFLLSEEIQMKYTKGEIMRHSVLREVYENKELCKDFDCNLFKNLQMVARPSSLVEDYEYYSQTFRNYVYQYLYGNSTAQKTLKKIYDITAVYSIDYNSIIGKASMAIIVLIITIIVFSFILISNNIFNTYFKMFNKKLWFLSLLGLCIGISYGFFMFGEMTIFKCITKWVCFQLGTSLFFYPILVKEIIYFPEDNKYSDFVKKHGFLVFLFFSSFDIITISLLYILHPYQIKIEIVEDGMNFRRCILSSGYYYLYHIIVGLEKAFVFSSIAILNFLEWNSEIIYADIRNISYIIYCNIITSILFILVETIAIKNIYAHVIIRIIVGICYSLVNYTVIVILRIYQETNNSSKDNKVKIKRENKNAIISKNLGSDKRSFKSKMMGYHFSPGASQYLPDRSKTNLSSTDEPELILFTRIIPQDQMTDISNENTSSYKYDYV
ncbi:periplasmic binding protein-like II [Anaeromyces robustus]|uniref:Periplasmic binding protein-like II n=1 Tax=Anaeromyces robustus TaxID=1754192 RepID=A0A1Y1X400_9FUNG|nr:periplasmic binding protein-like II [Anaeromyces robustus]|eukprot:ORX80432.1 periplasmic binding protein-like II [Anaeromyces robustus]